MKTNRLDETKTMNCGSVATIIEYNNANDFTVKFEDGYIKNNCQIHSWNNGNISNPYSKTQYGIGYIGDGKYNVNNKAYNVWHNMLKRCYKNSQPSYTNCDVCIEWHNFQNFALWYENNYYEILNERIEIDKDILFHNNRTYSPEKCLLVPQKINSLFISSRAMRGNYPIGVHYCKSHKKFGAHLCIKNKQKSLGWFNNSEDAFKAYKKAKEEHIKNIANEYKNKIPQKLYDAIYRYEVYIND